MGPLACSPALACVLIGFHSNELNYPTVNSSSTSASLCCLMTHTKSHVIYMHSQVHDGFRCISSKMIAVLTTEQIPEWRIEPSSRLLYLIQVPFHPAAANHASHTYMLSTPKVLSVFAVSDLSSKCYCTSPPFHQHRGRVSIFCHTSEVL